MGTAARAPRRRTIVTSDHAGQIKTRERVRDLAEVHTHKREEVDAMLDLVADMFPSDENPGNTDRKFLEPAAGSGNFLEEILQRKVAYVTADKRGGGGRQAPGVASSREAASAWARPASVAAWVHGVVQEGAR